jgi:CRISPR system Cascade subunit CasE
VYLSKLVLDPRHPMARRDLANPYELHATLSVALDDPQAARPLWRLEQRRPPVALVQTITRPDFSRVTSRDGYTGYFLAPPESKAFLLPERLAEGQVLRFRLEANPTVTRAGKRHGLRRAENQLAWLDRQAAAAGVDVLGATVSRVERRSFQKHGGQGRIVLLAVCFDGYLRVRNPEHLRGALARGVGHGKAMGLGLLSVALAR